MYGLLAAFFSSFIATLLIIRYQHLHTHFSADSDLSGPQKFHKKIVPRIGGIAIGIGIFIAIVSKLKYPANQSHELILFICAIPTFAIGLTEDITKKISVRLRLFFTAISALLLIYLLEVRVNHLDVPYLDYLISIQLIGIFFTAFAITGLSNAYNIIDGFNGLASMVAIITLLAIAYMGYIFADQLIIYLSIVMTGAIIGFFIWNYPHGLIFLGDGGAYLIGFWIAALSIMLIVRHPEISPWFALLINGYPILETLFTIYRRRVHQGRRLAEPDGVHFHTLIFRRVIKEQYTNNKWLNENAKTSPYLWVLAGLSIAPAVLWWNSTIILATSWIIFVILYIWLYSRIVKFKIPKWIRR